MFWTEAVEQLRALIFAVAHLCNGSLGLGIFFVSLGLRLALLPLTLRLARRGLERQRRLAALKPALVRLQEKYRDDPAEFARRSYALHRRHGIQVVDAAVLRGSLIQMPVLGGLFTALREGIGAGVRFGWIRDLSLPSTGLALLVTAATIAGVYLVPTAESSRAAFVATSLLLGGATLWFLTSTSAAFGVAAGAGALVSVVQGLLLRRESRS
jgi:membrane protein insertase Oxa1/YidC/SpoIIIJ